MTIEYALDDGAYEPTRAHSTDAGLDLRSPVSVLVRAQDSVTIDTGVHIAVPEGFVGLLKSRSGLNVRNSITSEGVIDAGYTGSIVVKLYNHGDDDYRVAAGDKISQLLLVPIITPELRRVSALGETERGTAGFGSTGR